MPDGHVTASDAVKSVRTTTSVATWRCAGLAARSRCVLAREGPLSSKLIGEAVRVVRYKVKDVTKSTGGEMQVSAEIDGKDMTVGTLQTGYFRVHALGQDKREGIRSHAATCHRGTGTCLPT
jgi:hypothetical protein